MPWKLEISVTSHIEVIVNQLQTGSVKDCSITELREYLSVVFADDTKAGSSLRKDFTWSWLLPDVLI